MKYRVYGIWTASKYLGEFEADTEEQAIEMAANSDNNHAQLCHQCAHEIELAEFSAEEFQAEIAD